MSGTRSELISQLSVLLPAGLPHEVVLGRALHVAHRWLEADCTVLVGCSHCGSEIAFMGVSVTHEEWESPRYHFAHFVVNRVVASRVCCLTSDAQPDKYQDIARTIGLHSIMCVPLFRTSALLGVIYVQRRLTTAIYTPDDLDLLETIARFVAMTLP